MWQEMFLQGYWECLKGDLKDYMKARAGLQDVLDCSMDHEKGRKIQKKKSILLSPLLSDQASPAKSLPETEPFSTSLAPQTSVQK